MKARAVLLSSLVLGLFACVPKTQFEDQQAKLKEAQDQVKDLQQSVQECDPDTFTQLREQAQSLDILTNELVTRNTELSNENARLRVFEAKMKEQEQGCNRQADALRLEYEGKNQRTKATYEDMIKELQAKIKRLEDENQALKSSAASSKKGSKGPKNGSPAAKDKK